MGIHKDLEERWAIIKAAKDAAAETARRNHIDRERETAERRLGYSPSEITETEIAFGDIRLRLTHDVYKERTYEYQPTCPSCSTKHPNARYTVTCLDDLAVAIHREPPKCTGPQAEVMTTGDALLNALQDWLRENV